MRIVFIRHGEPDYENDSLTESGRKQAADCANRLKDEGITEVYASPCGRAALTASYTADTLGLPVKTLEFMREITWGGPDIPYDGHLWTLSDMMINNDDFDFDHKDWKEHPSFKNNKVTQCYEHVVGGFEGFLKEQGLRKEGRRFFCESDNDKTIAIFSHGGSGACALSSLLSLPFPYVSVVFPYGFTSVIIIDLPMKKGSYTHPVVELFNDMAHVTGNKNNPVIFQQVSE